MITANAGIIEWLANLLMHSAWMGTVVALVVWAVVRRATDPRHVHNLAFGGLLLVVVGLITTGIWTWPSTMFHAKNATPMTSVPAPLSAEASVASPAQSFSSMPTAIGPADTIWNWQTLLVALWCLGVLIMALRHACGWWRALFLRQSATRVGGAIALRFTSLCRAAGMHPPLLLASSRIAVPVAIGWWRQAVILPVSVLTGVPSAQLDALLLHELAHLRRHDWLVEVITSLIESLLFFHPAVWWLGRRLRQAREQCCDSQAVSLGATPDGLTRALLALAERTAPDSPLLAATGGVLTERVRGILGLPKKHHGHWRSLVVITMLPVLLVIISACTRTTPHSHASTEPLRTEPLDPEHLASRFSAPNFSHEHHIRARADGRAVEVHITVISAPIGFWHELDLDGESPVRVNQSTLKRVFNAAENDKRVTSLACPSLRVLPLQQGHIGSTVQNAYLSDYEEIRGIPDPIISILNHGNVADLCAVPVSSGVILNYVSLVNHTLIGTEMASFTRSLDGKELTYPLEMPVVLVNEGRVESDTLLTADDALAIPVIPSRILRGSLSCLSLPREHATISKRIPDPNPDTLMRSIYFITAEAGDKVSPLNASTAAWLDTARITLNLHQATLKTALTELATQLPVPVEVSRDADYAATRIDLIAKAEPARSVIERLLSQCALNITAEPLIMRVEQPSEPSTNPLTRTRTAETLTGPASDPTIVLRMFDVTDIVENHPEGGVASKGANELATTLMKTICASTWVGDYGIEARGNVLFVNAAPAVQNFIEAELQRRRDLVTQPIKPDAPK